MDPHHRKIDLQSPSDLLYLHSNIKSAAQQKLDLAIPPSAAPEGEDAFRTKVEELVQEYISQTLTLALPSLTLNGLDASPSILAPTTESATPNNLEDDANYESYDPRLAAKLRTLYATLEYESTRVAGLRREAPGAAARAYMERLEVEREEQRARDSELEGWIDRGAKEEEEGSPQGLWKMERGEEMERMWGRGLEGLVGLGEVTEVAARLERAGKAAEIVENM